MRRMSLKHGISGAPVRRNCSPTSTWVLERCYFLADHLGSIRDLTDGSSVLDHIEYAPFGGVTTQTGATSWIGPGFTGLWENLTAGIVIANRRTLLVATGQWMQEDPIGFHAMDANLRRYVFNQPGKYEDPNGTDIWIEYDVPNCGYWHYDLVIGVFAADPRHEPLRVWHGYQHGNYFDGTVTSPKRGSACGTVLSPWYLTSTSDQDSQAITMLNPLVGSQRAYFLATYNCRSFAMDAYTWVQGSIGLSPATPTPSHSRSLGTQGVLSTSIAGSSSSGAYSVESGAISAGPLIGSSASGAISYGDSSQKIGGGVILIGLVGSLFSSSSDDGKMPKPVR